MSTPTPLSSLPFAVTHAQPRGPGGVEAGGSVAGGELLVAGAAVEAWVADGGALAKVDAALVVAGLAVALLEAEAEADGVGRGLLRALVGLPLSSRSMWKPSSTQW